MTLPPVVWPDVDQIFGEVTRNTMYSSTGTEKYFLEFHSVDGRYFAKALTCFCLDFSSFVCWFLFLFACFLALVRGVIKVFVVSSLCVCKVV